MLATMEDCQKFGKFNFVKLQFSRENSMNCDSYAGMILISLIVKSADEISIEKCEILLLHIMAILQNPYQKVDMRSMYIPLILATRVLSST